MFFTKCSIEMYAQLLIVTVEQLALRDNFIGWLSVVASIFVRLSMLESNRK